MFCSGSSGGGQGQQRHSGQHQCGGESASAAAALGRGARKALLRTFGSSFLRHTRHGMVTFLAAGRARRGGGAVGCGRAFLIALTMAFPDPAGRGPPMRI